MPAIGNAVSGDRHGPAEQARERAEAKSAEAEGRPVRRDLVQPTGARIE